VVIIIVGILAALGFTQYTKMVEKGRTAEAKSVLGTLRTAQEANFLEKGVYASLANLPISAPAACTTTHYYSYACAVGTGTCTASRCITGGKTPNAAATYNVVLTVAGTWSGTAGYY